MALEQPTGKNSRFHSRTAFLYFALRVRMAVAQNTAGLVKRLAAIRAES